MGGGFFVWQSQRSESMSELALANVEALASGESVEMQDCSRALETGNCYDEETNEWRCIYNKRGRLSSSGRFHVCMPSCICVVMSVWNMC